MPIASGGTYAKIPVIPEDWEMVKLGKYTRIKHGWAFKGEYFAKEGKYIVLTPGNFFEEGGFKINIDKIKYYTGTFPVEYILKKNDLIIAMTEQASGLLGSPAFIPEDNRYLHNQRLGLFYDIVEEAISVYYIYYLFCTKYVRQSIISKATGTKVKHISPTLLLDMMVPLPCLKEQQKIVDMLLLWDNVIVKQALLIKTKKIFKKGLIQKFLSGEVRFTGFTEAWKFIKLREVLVYEQPTPYLVANKSYDKNYKTPVLTAGKTFILGYTQEDTGIFSAPLPVIIFDDFTTATQFVDFPFKVKSSAMKILKAKDEHVNIKFIFEWMQLIHYDAYDHKRYWISEYQDIEIKLPSKEEQEKIVALLTLIDTEITLLQDELKLLKEQKQGLMQKLLSAEVRVLV